MNIKHSKYKNTGILFELLVRQITADTLNGILQDKAMEAIANKRIEVAQGTYDGPDETQDDEYDLPLPEDDVDLDSDDLDLDDLGLEDLDLDNGEE
jgi:hypothetical protein